MNDIELLKFIQSNFPRPFLLRELAKRLRLSGDHRLALKQQIKQMVVQGKLIRIKGQRFGLPTAMNLVVGILQASSKGFGYVIPEDVRQADVFVEGRDFGTAMHGDKIVVRVEGKNRMGKPKGRIIRILERAHDQIVGVFDYNRNFCFVVPDEKRLFHDIYINRKKTLGAQKGQKVVVSLQEWKSEQLNPEGEIITVLGYPDEQGVDIQSIIEKHELPTVFPARVLREAGSLAEQAIELDGRLDLRNQMTITIDPEDAKDLDDAVSLENTENGFRLGVHIADVSHYVKESNALDQEARLRGNSVYLVDRVIPMLPPELSNGICSLHPNVDRLTMSCIMDFDKKGNITHSEFANSVICTHTRFNYEQVQAILVDGDRSLKKHHEEVLPLLEKMSELAMLLRNKRKQQGSIDFNLPETKVILDKKGKPIEIRKVEHNLSHQIIEEFMLAANRTVATHMHNQKMPFLFRVHPSPDIDKLMEFAGFIRPLGYKLKVTDPLEPKELQRLLNHVSGKPEEHLINQVLLRSMKEARYSVENVGHFGLATSFYTHFTSPIRRYPDLVVHRLLRRTLQHKTEGINTDELYRQLESICKHTSTTERQAMEAERESQLIKKIEFLKDHVGKEYLGVITGVASYGFFVELQDFLVEGLVHVSAMTDDYYKFVEEKYSLEGEHNRRQFRLGDRVQVRIMKVGLQKKEIDLRIVDE
jgi:ribonuclease R